MFILPVDDGLHLRLHDDYRVADFYRLIDENRAYIRRYLEWPDYHHSVANTAAYIRSERRSFASGNAISTRIYRGEQVVGSCGLTILDASWKIAEIGYWLGEEYSGQGIATRATRALLDYGFGVLGLHKIIIRAIHTNQESLGIPQRLGMQHQGIDVAARLLDGVYYDYDVYYALADSWQLPPVLPEFACHLGDDLELRVLETRHAPALFALSDANRNYLRQWLPWLDNTRSVQDTRAFIETGLRQYANHDGLQLGIWYRGELCGATGYHYWDSAAEKTEIGYWLAESHTGKGIMTRAVTALIDYAFDVVGMHRIEIPCAVGNARSCAIPRRLGFTHEGIVRSAEWLYDHYVDWNMFALLRHEWRR